MKIRLHDRRLPKAVICDIDGTLAHMNDLRGPFDYMKIGDDECDRIIRDLLISLSADDHHIIIMSGREDSCREATIQWLNKHDVPAHALLLMRKTGDHRKDSIIKLEMFEAEVNGKYDVRFVLDDRKQVVDMWRAEGIKCLQVEEGNF